MRQLSILLVDDRDDFRQSFADWLRDSLGHAVQEAKTFDRGISLFSESTFDLAIVDYSLDPEGPGDGIDLLIALKEAAPEFPVIMITGYGNRPIAKKALKAGALWYLDKPPDPVEIEVLLQQVANSVRHSASMLSAISEAIAASQNIVSLMSSISRMAETLLHAKRCQLLIVNPETNRVQPLLDNSGFLDNGLGLIGAFEQSIGDGEAKMLSAEDASPALASSGVQTLFIMPCPPKALPTSLIVACFESRLVEGDSHDLLERGKELGQIIGATLPNLYAQQLNEEVAAFGQSLLRAGSSEEVYEAIRVAIRRNFEVSSFYLCLVESASRQLSFPLVYEREEALNVHPLPLSESKAGSLSEHIIKTGEALELPDQKSLETFSVLPHSIGRIKTKSYFGVPIRIAAAQPVLGVLSIQNDVEGRFSRGAQRVLREIAHLAAPAIARLRKRALGEEVLNHILSNDPQDVIREIAQALKELVFADIVTFYPYDNDRGEFGRPSIEIGCRLIVEDSAWPSEKRTLACLLVLREHFASSIIGDQIFEGDWINRVGAESSCGLILRSSQEEQVQGALLLHFRSPRSFNDEERSEIRRFSERAALALYIAEIIEERKAMDSRSRAENEVIDAAHTDDRLALVRILKEAAPSIWPKSNVRIDVLLYDRRTSGYQYLDGQPANIEPADDPFSPVAASPTTEILPSASPKDIMADERILLPISVGDSRLGLLLCVADERVLGGRDRSFLERLARTLASTLIAAAKEQRVELIKEVAARAAADPANALATVAEQTHLIATGAGGAPTSTTIFLLTGTTLEPVSAFPVHLLVDFRQSVGAISIEPVREKGRGIVARAVLQKETQRVSDVDADVDYIALDPLTRAELAVPVFGFDREVVGVLNIEFQNPNLLSDDDCSLVEALAEQTTVVNVLQTQALALTKAEKATTISATLAILGINAANSGHQLKGAIGSLGKEVDLCKRLFEGLFTENANSLKVLLSLISHPRRVTKRLLDIWDSLRRIGVGLTSVSNGLEGSTELVTEKNNVFVGAWISRLVETWRKNESGVAREAAVEFVLDSVGDPRDTVFVNEHWLTAGLNNLISNSVRAVRKVEGRTKKIVIRVYSNVANRLVRIEVHDNGPGIPETVAKHLFSAQISRELVEPGGNGTGCLMSSFIAQVYGGRIYQLPDKDEGAHVAVELPMSEPTTRLLFGK